MVEFEGALIVDVEEGDLFAGLDCVNRRFCGSIEIAVHFEMLDEFLG